MIAESSIPLLIKPWHKATLRFVSCMEYDNESYVYMNKGYYRLSFEGPGFKKVWPGKFDNADQAVPIMKKLGFTKYRIQASPSSRGGFYEYNVRDVEWRTTDGDVDWEEFYNYQGLMH